MLNTALALFVTSYVAWYIERHEHAAIYPFDTTHETPEAAGEPRLVEDLFQTEDGQRLVVWKAEAAPHKPTILYFSGNAGGLKERSGRFRRLIDQGYGVIAPAYRGSSGSTGTPEEEILVSDALALAQSITRRPLILYGESLGAAVAIRLAAEGIGSRIVLEAPFTSIPEVLSAQFPGESLDGLITQKWESYRVVARLVQPLLVVHGDRDALVPFAMGQRIHDSAGSRQKRLHRVSGGEHTGLWTVEMQRVLFDFLNDG